jgi:MinD-like ATPase involved in chromosome partitioning or flagellar assembly
MVELSEAVDKSDPASARLMSRELENFKIKLIVNMVKSKEDVRVGEIIKTVADKYLGITVDLLKPIPFDREVEKSILFCNPLILNEAGSKIAMSMYEVAMDILKV